MKSSPLAVALLGCIATGFASLGACGGATPSNLLTPAESGDDASPDDSGHGGGPDDSSHGGSSSGDDANGDEPASCSSQTCVSGCCANGMCTPGLDDTACGVQGAECQDCTGGGNVCLNGACSSSSSSSSSSGGSSGGSCNPLTCTICLGAAACCTSAGNCGCSFGPACL